MSFRRRVTTQIVSKTLFIVHTPRTACRPLWATNAESLRERSIQADWDRDDRAVSENSRGGYDGISEYDGKTISRGKAIAIKGSIWKKKPRSRAAACFENKEEPPSGHSASWGDASSVDSIADSATEVVPLNPKVR